jgi:hypothetical protein
LRRRVADEGFREIEVRELAEVVLSDQPGKLANLATKALPVNRALYFVRLAVAARTGAVAGNLGDGVAGFRWRGALGLACHDILSWHG